MFSINQTRALNMPVNTGIFKIQEKLWSLLFINMKLETEIITRRPDQFGLTRKEYPFRDSGEGECACKENPT